ncbi:MAG: H-X9-DG-CTERM domain-containing protein, partial [Pirellulaceae bacterium]
NIMVWRRTLPTGTIAHEGTAFSKSKLCQINGLATNRKILFSSLSRGVPPINLMLYAARPSSNHRGGVMVAFADGHTAFVTNSISYVAYQSLLTPDNEKSSMPPANRGYHLTPDDKGN